MRESVQEIVRAESDSSQNALPAFSASSTSTAFQALVKALPNALLRQYEYEDPKVKEGKHLMHSSYFKELLSLAAEIELDNSPLCVHKWAWLKRFAITHRASFSLCERAQFPEFFLEDVRRKVSHSYPTSRLFLLLFARIWHITQCYYELQ